MRNKLTTLAALVMAASSARAQFTLGGNFTTGCPASYQCNNFSVAAPGIPKTTGRIAIKRGATGGSGLVEFHSGSGGGKWWADTPAALVLLDNLVAADYDVLMVSWPSGWIHAPKGINLGSHLLAQRPDTVLKWSVNNVRRGGRMIAVGSSNGSSQIAYSMALYGANTVLDLAVIVSGPPFMMQCAACSGADPNLEFAPGEKGLIDATFGYGPKVGPCYLKASDWCDWEGLQSVETAGTYNYPTTAVKILLGASDDYKIRARGQAYFDLLTANGQPGLSVQYVPNTGHAFTKSQLGLDAIYAAVTQ